MAAPNTSSPPTPTPAAWGPPHGPQSTLHRPRGELRGGRGFLVKSTLEGSPEGISEGVARASLPDLGRQGCGAKQQGRPDFPATYPDHHGLIAFKFGDEFVPAEDLSFVEWPEPAHHFDAAFGWIRHLCRRQREGARGWAGVRGSAQLGRWSRTAPPATRPPPAASDEASQQVIANSAGWAALAAPRPGRWAVYQPLARPAAHLPSLALPWPCAASRDHLPRTTRRADEATRREQASPGSDLPGSCELSHPASAPARSGASPPRPFAPPSLGPPRDGDVTAEIRPALGQAPRAKRPGTCSRCTCGWKDKDAWSWLSETTLVPRVTPPRACRSWLAAQVNNRMDVTSNIPG